MNHTLTNCEAVEQWPSTFDARDVYYHRIGVCNHKIQSVSRARPKTQESKLATNCITDHQLLWILIHPKAIGELLSWKNRHLPDAERWEKMRSILEENPGVVLEQNEMGDTLLHWAAFDSSPEQCMVLLEFDPTRELLQLRSARGWSPIHCACIAGNLETARYLLGLHPDGINMTDNEEYNCLHLIFSNHGLMVMGQVDERIIDFVRFLLSKAPWLISSSTKKGDLPLHIAFFDGHSLPVLLSLYNAHPEAIYRRNNNGLTPLARAGAIGYDDDEEEAVITFFRALINEARTTTPDALGRLPLHRALLNANLPVGTIELIIDANPVSTLIADRLGQTPLAIACRHCNIHVIKYLVEACKDALQINDAYGELPLHIACRHGRCNVVKWILERSNAGLSVQNNEGNIPIQLLLYDADCNRNSLEYMQAVYMLLRAYPEAVIYLRG
jgi:ankyrin repeat protein